jgi:SAM-dependent methyltransferase
MGASKKTLSRIVDLHKRELLPTSGSILDLGAQELYAKGDEGEVRAFIDYFARHDRHVRPVSAYNSEEIEQLADKGFHGQLLTACGFKYRALDIFSGYNTTLFDLNIHQLGQDDLQKFDLATNFGTTEHVINQFLAMKTMHDAVRPGGVIYHDLPLSGYFHHGYFSYTPVFFRDLAIANNYEVVFEWYSKGSVMPTPQSMRDHGFPDSGVSDYGIEFIFRKTSEIHFRVPLETTTSLAVDHSIWTAAESRRGDGMPVEASVPASTPVPGSYVPVHYAVQYRPTGRELQRELLSRYRQRIAQLFRFKR